MGDRFAADYSRSFDEYPRRWVPAECSTNSQRSSVQIVRDSLNSFVRAVRELQ